MAEWEDEQIEYIKEKVTDEGRQEDLIKGKEPAQVLNLVDYDSVEFYFSHFTISYSRNNPHRLHWMKLLFY